MVLTGTSYRRLPNVDIMENPKLGFQIQAIDLVSFSISQANIDTNKQEHSFSINIGQNINEASQNIAVRVEITILSDTISNTVLGSLVVDCEYQLEGIVEAEGVDIPQGLTDILNSISISTVRGLMFGLFRGTHLHNLILPIIDPKSITVSSVN
jgi:hypothetical protein